MASYKNILRVLLAAFISSCVLDANAQDILENIRIIENAKDLPYILMKPEPHVTKGQYNTIFSPAPDTVWKIFQFSRDKKEWYSAERGGTKYFSWTFQDLENDLQM